MEKFLAVHSALIAGVLCSFDRVIFKGHLPLGFSRAMEDLLSHNGLLIKDFKSFVFKQAVRIKEHARTFAQQHGRPFLPLSSPIAMETRASQIVEQEKLKEGLVCIFSQVEPCRSFKIGFGDKRPRILAARRKCLFIYYYFLDPELGLIHVRIQTWFPLTCQVYVNGHSFLARQMDRQGIAYEQWDNAFVSISDPKAAQALADQFARIDWPSKLEELACRVNPLMQDLLKNYSYYWATDQAEYATDIMFKDPAALRELTPLLVQYATLGLGAEDILRFLGRKLHGKFLGEVLSDCKKRILGTRVKHRMKSNWIKMYDKHARMLRIETVINDPYEFKVRRLGKRQGKEVMDWFPMAKGVANLPRYEEVSRAANVRYLDALSVVSSPPPASKYLEKISHPVSLNNRSIRGFNPMASEDLHIFEAVMRGEHMLNGFRNRDIRTNLFGDSKTKTIRRSQSARTSRILLRLRAHGLIAKIPRSRRYRVSALGQPLLAACLRYHKEYLPEAIQRAA